MEPAGTRYIVQQNTLKTILVKDYHKILNSDFPSFVYNQCFKDLS